MDTMTHRERILAGIQRKPSDRIPLDLGSTLATTMTAGAHERMRAHLGIPSGQPPATLFRRAGTVLPDEAILSRFDVDGRALLVGGPDGRPDREISADAFVDEWGVTWSRPETGHYINTDGPFHCLDEPAPEHLKKFAWPNPADPGRYRGLRERAQALHQNSDYAVVLNLGVGPIHQCQFMRGYAEWLGDLLACPVFAEDLLDRATDIWIEIASRALRHAADYVDVVIYGDDIGTQKATLIRPELYRRLIKPRHKRMADAIKRYGKPIVYHSCGSVRALIPDLIEIGIDALNPIQVAAAGMDPKTLKREFGRDLSFWGAIDNQHVLPFGTVEEVRAEVRTRIDELGQGGGYVLCAAHNIQHDVPPENVVAMYEAALESGR
jgi:uroporphyrinogen decarboxylase